MKRNNKKGFTIVELVIVIAVIAILSAVLIPTFGGIVDKANQSAVLQEAQNEYKLCYALDLSDGVIDGEDGDTDVTATKGTYTVTSGTATYELADADRGFTAKYDGSEWTVVKYTASAADDTNNATGGDTTQP